MNIDYTPLTEPVTRQEVSDYRKDKGLLKKVPVLSSSFWAAYMVVAFFAAMKIPTDLFLNITVILALASIIYFTTTNRNIRSIVRLRKFARVNNLRLLMNQTDPPYRGVIFEAGHTRWIKDGFQFPDDTIIGNFSYMTGHGKNAKESSWGFVRVQLTRHLPHMLLDAKLNNTLSRLSGLPNLPNRDQILKLEGDFNNHFTLYAPKEYERDALYIFTPDVMAALIDVGRHYDIEIIDDSLIIYNNQPIQLSSPEVIEKLLVVVNKLSSELHDQTKRYSDQRVDEVTENNINLTGQRLKSSKIGKIALKIVIIAIFFYAAISLHLFIGPLLQETEYEYGESQMNTNQEERDRATGVDIFNPTPETQ